MEVSRSLFATLLFLLLLLTGNMMYNTFQDLFPEICSCPPAPPPPPSPFPPPSPPPPPPEKTDEERCYPWIKVMDDCKSQLTGYMERALTAERQSKACADEVLAQKFEVEQEIAKREGIIKSHDEEAQLRHQDREGRLADALKESEETVRSLTSKIRQLEKMGYVLQHDYKKRVSRERHEELSVARLEALRGAWERASARLGARVLLLEAILQDQGLPIPGENGTLATWRKRAAAVGVKTQVPGVAQQPAVIDQQTFVGSIPLAGSPGQFGEEMRQFPPPVQQESGLSAYPEESGNSPNEELNDGHSPNRGYGEFAPADGGDGVGEENGD
eukprot:jgi/Mesvir1/23480/Mv22328-RA.1